MKWFGAFFFSLAACSVTPSGPLDNPSPFTGESSGSSSGSTTGSSGGTSTGTTGSTIEAITPETLGNFGANGQVYFAASSAGSNIVVIDNFSGSGAHTYQWMHYETASGWSAVASLLPAATPAFTAAALATDANGNAIFAYLTQATPNQLFVMHYAHSRLAWDTPQQPDTYDKGLNGSISLAMNAGGDALVLYQRSGSDDDLNAYVLSYSNANDTWTRNSVTTGNISDAPGGVVKVRLADSGKAVAMFETSGLYTISLLSGSTWTAAPQQVGGAVSFDVAINDNGRVLVGTVTPVSFVYQSYGYSGSWDSDFTNVGDADTGTALGCALSVSVDALGDGYFQRCKSNGAAAPDVDLYTLSFDETQWISAAGLPVTQGEWPISLTLAFDPNGNALATWVESSSEGSASAVAPRFSTYELFTWSIEQSVTGTAIASHAYLTSNDRGWVVWEQGGTWMVQKVE